MSPCGYGDWEKGVESIGWRDEQAAHLTVLQAAASYTRQERLTTWVVLRRGPGIVAAAREAAGRAGVSVTLDLLADMVVVRFALDNRQAREPGTFDPHPGMPP